MKKLLTLSAVAVFAIGMTTSCKKDYTCTCTGGTILEDATYSLPKAKKKDAEEACDAFNVTYTADSGSCSL